jgi:hypothetical protein
MHDILQIKEGLPQEKRNTKPLLEQLNIDKLNRRYTGTLLFDDGELYMLSEIDVEKYKWFRLTSIKKEGLILINDLLRKDFVKVEKDLSGNSSSDTVQVWKAFIDGKEWGVRACSSSYNNLPKVFKKIDDSINKYMYKLNEQRN